MWAYLPKEECRPSVEISKNMGCNGIVDIQKFGKEAGVAEDKNRWGTTADVERGVFTRDICKFFNWTFLESSLEEVVAIGDTWCMRGKSFRFWLVDGCSFCADADMIYFDSKDEVVPPLTVENWAVEKIMGFSEDVG